MSASNQHWHSLLGCLAILVARLVLFLIASAVPSGIRAAVDAQTREKTYAEGRNVCPVTVPAENCG